MPAGVGRPPAERFLGRVERLLTETPRSWRTSNEERLAESPPRLRNGERNPENLARLSSWMFPLVMLIVMNFPIYAGAPGSSSFLERGFYPGFLEDCCCQALFLFRRIAPGTRKNIRTREQCPDLLKSCLYSALYVRPQSRWPQRRTGSRRSQTFRNIFSMGSGA
jgi:hypothetical protein